MRLSYWSSDQKIGILEVHSCLYRSRERLLALNVSDSNVIAIGVAIDDESRIFINRHKAFSASTVIQRHATPCRKITLYPAAFQTFS